MRETRDTDGADNGRTWGEIAERVKAIIERPGRKQERVDYWQEAQAARDLYAAAGGGYTFV